MKREAINLTKEEYDILFDKIIVWEKKHFKESKEKKNHHYDKTPILLEALLTDHIEDVEALKNMLALANVTDLDGKELINIGSTFRVEIDYFGEKETEEYKLVSPNEASSINNLISCVSPLGRAVKAKREGEGFSYQTEQGKVSGTILEIQKEKDDLKHM